MFRDSNRKQIGKVQSSCFLTVLLSVVSAGGEGTKKGWEKGAS